MVESCHSVLIVDDHDIVSAGIKALLKKYELCETENIDTASTYNMMLALLNRQDYDLLILDLHLGDVNTFKYIRPLKAQFPDMKILVCSMYPEDPYAIECIHEGALGYLHKTKVLDSFKNAFMTVFKGDTYIDPQYAQCLSYGMEMEQSSTPSLNKLSKREFEICNYIVSGMSFRQIAEKLEISSKTVSSHYAHILEKLSFTNMVQLIHFMLQHES
jgi:DNA-binding NarL/FixJ family response regulator